MTASITAAIRADAATSDAEGRAQAAEMVTALTIGALAETVTRLNASEDRALRLGRDLDNAVTARDAFAKSFDNALADLNATREKLTAAEASRDSLQAEADDAGKMLDAIRSMAGIGASRSEVDTLEVVRLRLECDREITAELRAERNALRAEVDKLRARPELTVGMYRARIDSLPGRAEQVVALLGPVTLPAQDAAAALWKAIDDQIVVEAEKVRDGSGVDWHSAYSGAIGTRAKAEAIVRAALASLGAPATTPSKLAEALDHEQRAALKPGVGYWPNASMNGLEAVVMGAMLTASGPIAISDATLLAMARGAVAAIEEIDAVAAPDEPADVFAGVSVEELSDAYDCAGACGSADVASRRCAGVTAILDALRVKLVAPVDPEAFARGYMERVVPGLYDACKSTSLHFSSMRLELEAKGIPVTPEAGK